MKKTLIASAVAAAALSNVAMADERSMPTFYGNLKPYVQYTDSEMNGSNYSFDDYGSTFGFKHKHEVMPGVTAFAKAEFEFASTGAKNGGGDSGWNKLDEAYVGMEGDFGKVWAGKDDAIYDETVDVTDFFEVLSTPTQYGGEKESSVFYQTPEFSGLTVSAQLEFGGQAGTKSPKTRDSLSLAATYSMDALTVSVGYAANERDSAGHAAMGLGATYKVDDSLTVAVQYETQNDVKDVFGLLGVYTMGANQFAAAYHYEEEDSSAGTDKDVLSLQALHNMSDNFYVFTEAQWTDEANRLASKSGETKQLLVGAAYSF